MKMQHCAVFDPDHYNIVDITNYEKYRQHIEAQREMEIQKAKAKRKRERKLIAQRIFCVMLMGVGYLLIRYASDTWPLGVTFILFGLLLITERKAILW